MKNILFLLTVGLLAVSCVPSTPQARIQQSPAMFAALSAKEKQLVQQGNIAKGLSKNAVFLAWGQPAMRYEGSKTGRPVTRWDYTSVYPVYGGSYYGAYGFGGYGHRGRHGHRGYPYAAYGFGPEISYVPYCKASVWFVNNRVDSWERLR